MLKKLLTQKIRKLDWSLFILCVVMFYAGAVAVLTTKMSHFSSKHLLCYATYKKKQLF